MKRCAHILGISFLATLASATALSAQCPDRGHIPGEFVELLPGKPFEAERVLIFSWPGARFADVSVDKLFRDKEGRLRTERYVVGHVPAQPEMLRIGPEDFAASETASFAIPSGTQPRYIRLYDPCALRQYFLEPAKRAASFTAIRPANYVPYCQARSSAQARQLTESPLAMTAEEILQRRLFAGVDAFGDRTSFYENAENRDKGQPVTINEIWCSEQLQMQLGFYRHDTRARHDVKMVVRRLVQKTPQATLFDVPPDYQLQELDLGGTPAASTNALEKKTP